MVMKALKKQAEPLQKELDAKDKVIERLLQTTSTLVAEMRDLKSQVAAITEGKKPTIEKIPNLAARLKEAAAGPSVATTKAVPTLKGPAPYTEGIVGGDYSDRGARGGSAVAGSVGYSGADGRVCDGSGGRSGGRSGGGGGDDRRERTLRVGGGNRARHGSLLLCLEIMAVGGLSFWALWWFRRLCGTSDCREAGGIVIDAVLAEIGRWRQWWTTVPDSTTRIFVDWHPGKGKTRKVILQEAVRHVEEQRRLLILTPTRVVMDEVKEAVKGKLPNGVRLGTSLWQARSFAVTVACHATLTNFYLESAGKERPSFATVIMDECHFLDPFSIAARGIMEDMHSRGTSLLYLSATPPGHPPSSGSNFPITEIGISIRDPKDPSCVHSWKGQKTIIFVATIKEATDLFNRVPGSVILSRETFDKNMAEARDESTKFVISTEISEMGANLGVDTVIDLRQVMRPIIADDRTVGLRRVPVTHASAVQRRGRTGRRAPGRYVFNEAIEPDDS
ncbi:uncharacterized protein LOC128276428, partial [Anopheles cruzii]|uniref:uncharacterized protein LOC128276428 n=1 Tax=Anopheles cruzii TaxID=68878 RepID=UPI0022EC1888